MDQPCKDCVTKDEMITSLVKILGFERESLRLAKEAADDAVKAGRDMQKALKAYVEHFDPPTLYLVPTGDGEVE